jgi:putative two-component system response regulator
MGAGMTGGAQRKFILIVDDTPANIAVVTGILKDIYRLKAATQGEKALALITASDPPDLILLDVMMPDMDGYEVCRRLKSNPDTADIPVIFLTAMTDADDETAGLDIGAVDYIHKPFNPAIIKARIHNHILLREQRHLLQNQNKSLERLVEERTQQLSLIQDVTIMALTSLAETRDNETGNHIRRTQHYVRELAKHLATHPRFSHYLTPTQIELLYKSAPLHDIGKVGIPDAILLKPGRLDPEEFEIMKRHTELGRAAISSAEQRLGIEVPFLAVAKEIAYYHQEKWDGTGYPNGLAGEAIPISARLMAVADVYDALISNRPYKASWSHEEAIALIRNGAGSQFDPDIAEAFVSIDDKIRAIAVQYADQGQL